MKFLKCSTILAALPALAATPVLAHGGHAPVAAAAHGPLHLLMAAGGVFAVGLIIYLTARVLRSRSASDPN